MNSDEITKGARGCLLIGGIFAVLAAIPLIGFLIAFLKNPSSDGALENLLVGGTVFLILGVPGLLIARWAKRNPEAAARRMTADIFGRDQSKPKKPKPERCEPSVGASCESYISSALIAERSRDELKEMLDKNRPAYPSEWTDENQIRAAKRKRSRIPETIFFGIASLVLIPLLGYLVYKIWITKNGFGGKTGESLVFHVILWLFGLATWLSATYGLLVLMKHNLSLAWKFCTGPLDNLHHDFKICELNGKIANLRYLATRCDDYSSKKCERCDEFVSSKRIVGDSCPYCGARFVAEKFRNDP